MYDLCSCLSSFSDNPNIPHGRFNYNQAFFWPTKGEVKIQVHFRISCFYFQHGMEIHEKIGLYPKDPGPSWKKWEDKEE